LKNILLLKNIEVIDATAYSSPFSIGFPSITSFLGFSHALQIKLNKKYKNIKFISTGIISHKFEINEYKDIYTDKINCELYPIKKDTTKASIVQNPKCSMTISLIIEYKGVDKKDEEEVLRDIKNAMYYMRISGGDIFNFDYPKFKIILDDKTLKKVKNEVMPGYAIIDSTFLIDDYNDFDGIIDYIKMTKQFDISKDKYTTIKKDNGWLIPLSIGYNPVSDFCEVQNQRSYEYKHRFVENLITLGEFIMPYKIDDLDEIMWQHCFENDRYICKQVN